MAPLLDAIGYLLVASMLFFPVLAFAVYAIGAGFQWRRILAEWSPEEPESAETQLPIRKHAA